MRYEKDRIESKYKSKVAPSLIGETNLDVLVTRMRKYVVTIEAKPRLSEPLRNHYKIQSLKQGDAETT